MTPTPLTLRHQIIDVPGLDELCRAFADGQCLEVSFATLNLGAFLVAQVVGVEAALGFDHEVEALSPSFSTPMRISGSLRSSWFIARIATG